MKVILESIADESKGDIDLDVVVILLVCESEETTQVILKLKLIRRLR